jgi:putative peptide zinc metalloprotease protein
MNISQALNVALPDIPARTMAQYSPRLHPAVVSKEHLIDREWLVRVYVPGVDAIFTFPPRDWKLIQLFNGVRSYEEIAELYQQETGTEWAVEDIRALSDDLESIDFWYKTAQEKNILLMQKSADERRKLLKKKKRWGDLGFVTFPAFNPDALLTWLHGRIEFVYTWWFTLLTLCGFGFMVGIFIAHWSELIHDSLQFFNFADKSLVDLAIFWGLTFVLSAIHESAHGVTCKHYGARVPAMGFALVYLSPAFYTDVSEGVVRGTPAQRLLITVAGVWSELCVCAIATPLWWGTAPGTPIHEFAYTLILITGIAVVLLNWNPLLKLDGYLILCDVLNILDLKEHSTAYVSAWVKKHIWKLPVEVPFVPRHRRLGFAFYAITSGLYSYTVLFVLARFVGNVFHNYTAEWSFIPELATAAIIFRSRIRTLFTFMKFVYLDKKDRIRVAFTPALRWGLAAAVAIFLLLPLWHDSISGRLLLEPVERAVVRTTLPGAVSAVYAKEGQLVSAGAPLLKLRNLEIDSQLAQTRAGLAMAGSRANSALLRNAGLGSASQDRERLRLQTNVLTAESRELEIRSPISGTILTPRVGDRLGSFLSAGTEVVEVANLSSMRGRIYISEYDFSRFQTASEARVGVDGLFGKRNARPGSISPVSSEIAPGLIDLTKYQGLRPPKFYVMDLLIDNSDGKLKPSMSGTARIYGRRRSLAGLGWEGISDFFGRKIW